MSPLQSLYPLHRPESIQGKLFQGGFGVVFFQLQFTTRLKFARGLRIRIASSNSFCRSCRSSIPKAGGILSDCQIRESCLCPETARAAHRHAVVTRRSSSTCGWQRLHGGFLMQSPPIRLPLGTGLYRLFSGNNGFPFSKSAKLCRDLKVNLSAFSFRKLLHFIHLMLVRFQYQNWISIKVKAISATFSLCQVFQLLPADFRRPDDKSYVSCVAPSMEIISRPVGRLYDFLRQFYISWTHW